MKNQGEWENNRGGWIVGIFFFLIALNTFYSSIMAALAMLTISILIFPPIILEIANHTKFNIKLHRWWIVVILFLMFAFIRPTPQEASKAADEALKAKYPNTYLEVKQKMIDEEQAKELAINEKRRPKDFLHIIDYSRSTKTVLILSVNFTVKNSASIPYKDIEVYCAQKGESGSTISSRNETIYTTILPNETKKFKDITFNFADPQTTEISCKVTDATLI